MAKFLLVEPNGRRSEVIITGHSDDQLKYIRISLGCNHFEGYRCNATVGMYIDENGKGNRTRNDHATRIFAGLLARDGRRMHATDFIAGPALFFGYDDDGNEVDLPPATLALVEQLADQDAPRV